MHKKSESMLLEISKEAKDAITRIFIETKVEIVPALKYSFQADTEQSYRQEGISKSAIFEKTRNAGASWELVSYKRETLAVELIYSSGEFQLAIVGPQSENATKAIVKISGGKFHVEFENQT